MQCPACQHENPAAATFCGECGARIATRCPSCGTANAVSNKFCHDCGTRLMPAAPTTPAQAAPAAPAPVAPEPPPSVTASAAGATAADRFADPQAYTPKHLAEKILTSKAAIAGERKQVTVVFTDVSGFTAMSERLDPEDVHAIMDRMFEVILAAVHRHEGTVNQFLGDGCMALFGAPIAHEDHAHRALRAALAIQHDLAALRADVARAHGAELRVRIGINTGPVVVGAIGRDLRMDYTAVGDTTNLAARLLNVAAPGQIVASEHTRGLTEGYFVFDDLGEFTVKGKTAPVRAAAVTAERRGRTRLEVSRDRGLTPLAGRAQEQARLQAAFDRAVASEGAVVWLSGEPGVGKSRLLYEFMQRIAATGVLDVEASCPSYGRSIPYHPVLAIVRSLARIDETTPPAEIEERLGDLLLQVGIEDDEGAALLAHFFGLTVASEFLVRLQGAELRQRTFRLLIAIVLNAAERRPCVIVVENLHWADDSSLEFFRQLAAAALGHRVMLLLSTRPEFTPAWREQACTDTITVGGLGREDVERMIGALLGANEVAPALVAMLLDRSGGNPLYLEEIVRRLQETQTLRVDRGRVQLDAGAVAVPETIHDIIAARVDRLQETLKQTLQPAAVVGREFAVPIVSRILGADGELVDRLTMLHQLDFVFPSAREPELAYTFKHALTQEVVYAGLLERRRRSFHADIAATLEELHAERVDDVVELLAYHYGRSSDDARAVDYAIRAGEKAQTRWANTEALAHFEAALKRLASMDDTTANRLRRIDAILKQSEIKFALGRHAEHVQSLEAIGDLVASTADSARRAAWHYWLGFLYSLTGVPPDRSIAQCRLASEIAEREGLDELRAFAECCLSHAYGFVGQLQESLDAGERALAVFETRRNVWWACRTLWVLSSAALGLGRWDLSLDYCRRSLDYGVATNDLRLKVVGLWRTGSTHIQRGAVEEGLRYCKEALALGPTPFDGAFAHAVHGYGLAKLGKPDEGIAEITQAVAFSQASNLRYTEANFALRLAEAYLRAGQHVMARDRLETVLAWVAEHGYRHLQGVALRLFSEALLPDDPAAAEERLSEARAILREAGACDEIARADVARAAIRRRAGAHEEARGLLEDALATFERLGTLDQIARTRQTLAALAQ